MTGRFRESRATRLRKGPDEVGVEDAMDFQRNAARTIVQRHQELHGPLLRRQERQSEGHSFRGIEVRRLGMTRDQFDHLSGFFEGLKRKALARNKLVWDISLSHVGAFRVTIPGATLSEPVEAAELTVRYIPRGGGRKEALAESDMIIGKLKRKLLRQNAKPSPDQGSEQLDLGMFSN